MTLIVVNLENPSAALGCGLALLSACGAAAIILAFFWMRASLANRRKQRLDMRYGERRACIESTAYRFLASVQASSYAISVADDASLLKVVVVDAVESNIQQGLDGALADAGCPVRTVLELTTSEQVLEEVGKKMKDLARR